MAPRPCAAPPPDDPPEPEPDTTPVFVAARADVTDDAPPPAVVVTDEPWPRPLALTVDALPWDVPAPCPRPVTTPVSVCLPFALAETPLPLLEDPPVVTEEPPFVVEPSCLLPFDVDATDDDVVELVVAEVVVVPGEVGEVEPVA